MRPEIESGINHLRTSDLSLARIIKKVGKCNLKPNRNYYHSLLESIISQQLSVKVADSIFGKFSNYFSNKPLPLDIISTDSTILRGLGLSNAKVKYVKDLSLKVTNNEISFRNIHKKDDSEIIFELTKVKGIGTWTAHMFLIFTIGRLNILPVGDLGIKRAVMFNYNLKKLPDEKKLRNIAVKNNWEPYSSIASWYLWKSLDIKNEF